MTTKKALVLSGGSVKGAFQAGAIKALIEKGYTFDKIYGISVGSLNGTFMCNEAGKQVAFGNNIDWKYIGDHLVDFWLEHIRYPHDIARKRKNLANFSSIVFNRFNGLVDTAPLHKLVRETIKLEYLRQSPLNLTVGAVNMADGEIVYANPAFPNFIDYVLASAAIPVIMPPVYIGDNKNQPFLDGGIRDVAPLKLAIKSGAEEIVCVLCHTKKLGGETFNPGNLMSLTERVMDIVVNELVNNDIKWATKFNKYLPDDGSKCFDGLLEGYRKVKITVIRPPSPINLNLEKFTTVDIQETIEAGYYAAMLAVL